MPPRGHLLLDRRGCAPWPNRRRVLNPGNYIAAVPILPFGTFARTHILIRRDTIAGGHREKIVVELQLRDPLQNQTLQIYCEDLHLAGEIARFDGKAELVEDARQGVQSGWHLA